jgi:MFS family permease
MADDEPTAPPVKPRRLADARVIALLTRTQFGSYLLGSSVSQTGTWIHRVAMMLLIWQITESAFWLGLFAMADLLPIVIFGPLAGAAADRWDRLALTKFTQWAQLAIALVLGALTLAGMINLTWLMTLAVAQGCAIAVNQPARMALIHSLAGRDDLGSAVALGSVSINVTRLIGPAIAGLLLLAIDVAWLFFLNAVLTAVFIVVLQRLRIAAPTSAAASGSMMELMRQGFNFAINDRQIRILLILLFVGGAGVRSMLELFTAFADAKFDSTASGLAVLTSSMAAGSTIAGLHLGIFNRPDGLDRRISLAWAAGSVSMVALALSTHPVAVVVAAVVSGYFATTCVINTQTYVQLAAPDALRGRVLSVHGVVLRASPALGALVAGYAIDRYGLSWPVIVSCAICFIAAVLAFAVQRRSST